MLKIYLAQKQSDNVVRQPIRAIHTRSRIPDITDDKQNDGSYDLLTCIELIKYNPLNNKTLILEKRIVYKRPPKG